MLLWTWGLCDEVGVAFWVFLHVPESVVFSSHGISLYLE